MPSDTPGVIDQVKERLTTIELTDDELLHLVGLPLSEKVQAAVDAATRRAVYMATTDLPRHIAGLVADVVTEARTTGQIVCQNRRIRHCPVCGKHAGYGTWKKGPRRGRPNYNRPLHMDGRELAQRFVSVNGYVSLGGCTECVNAAAPEIREALKGVEAQVPATFRAPGEPKRIRYSHRRCTRCGWEGHEGEMGRLRTLMGDGTYPAVCPSCSGEHRPLATSPFENIDGFTVVEEPQHSGASEISGDDSPRYPGDVNADAGEGNWR